MGWFNKKEEKKNVPAQGNIPTLPKLPELPELPTLKDKEDEYVESIHQLPSFPHSSLGEKFSQNTIKEAVTRSQKDDDMDFHYPEGKQGDEGFDANEFVPPKKMAPMMPKPLQKHDMKKMKHKEPPKIRVMDHEDFDFDNDMDFEGDRGYTPEMKYDYGNRVKRAEPVFIRIDRFEDGMKTFEKAKRELAEIEKILKDISKVKDEEEKQLDSWKNDIMKVKDQIEKVDQDIFSKLE